MSKTASGVRLYRNGFRVLPYGEPKDDWTNIDKRWSTESGKINIPLNNQNLFGFVEIIDPTGNIFEETASREGLIENDAFNQLSDFINKSLIAARGRIAERIKVFKEKQNTDDFTQDSYTKEHTTQEMFIKLKNLIDGKYIQDANTKNEGQDTDRDKKEGLEIIKKLENLIEEAGMLRVLAGLGLTIGEFTHEMKQFHSSVYSHISKLNQLNLCNEAQEQINEIKAVFDNLFSYTDYFGTTISQNTNRKKLRLIYWQFWIDLKKQLKTTWRKIKLILMWTLLILMLQRFLCIVQSGIPFYIIYIQTQEKRLKEQMLLVKY